MTVATVPLTDTFDQWRIKFNEVVTEQNAQISDVARASLLTVATDIVPAINEVKATADAASTAATGKVDRVGDTMTGDLLFAAAVDLKMSATSTIQNSTSEILLDEDGVGPGQVPLDAHVNGTFDSVLGFDALGVPEYVLKSSLGGGGGDFVSLTDTPANFTGDGGLTLRVNSGETAVEFVTPNYVDLGDSPANFSGDAYKTVRVSGASNALVHGGTGALLVDSGTTGQRPGSPVNGMIRYNSSNNEMEIYENGGWVALGSPFSNEFVSSQQVPPNASLLTVAHGLGTTPKLVTAELVCIVADLGWAIGDVVALASSNGTPSGSVAGTSIAFNATNVFISQFGGRLRVMLKNASTDNFITNASWRVVFRAYT